MKINIQVAVEFTSGPIEERRADYPLVALQQIVRNAILHRSYENTNALVRIHWFLDRVEVLNPGGPFGQVTRTNFGTAGAYDYRNPNLAVVMKNLDYVQRFGMGIAMAQKAMQANGNPAIEFQVEDTHVIAILRRKQQARRLFRFSTTRAASEKRPLNKKPVPDLEVPDGKIQPLGYVVLRHSIRLDRPVQASERWIARIPATYFEAVLGGSGNTPATIDDDPNCIAKLRDYRSLMPLAQEARKPMFLLKPADGALGAHMSAVANAYKDFRFVAKSIVERAEIPSW